MSEEYNPQAEIMEQIEQLEIEIKRLMQKRDRLTDPREREVVAAQVGELETQLHRLHAQLRS